MPSLFRKPPIVAKRDMILELLDERMVLDAAGGRHRNSVQPRRDSAERATGPDALQTTGVQTGDGSSSTAPAASSDPLSEVFPAEVSEILILNELAEITAPTDRENQSETGDPCVLLISSNVAGLIS